MYETAPYFYGTGRRKSSVARVRIYQGTGKITINDRDIDDYFGLDTLKYICPSAPHPHRQRGQVRHRLPRGRRRRPPARPAPSVTAWPAPCSSTTARTSAPC